MLEYGLIETLKAAVQRESEISEHLNGIYSYVPAEVQPPYIRVQASQDMRLNDGPLYGDVTLTVVSRYRGQLELYRLLKTLQKILCKPLITAAGHHLIFKETDVTITAAPDHITQTATMNFRVKLKF